MAIKEPYLNENGKLVTFVADGVEKQYTPGMDIGNGVLIETLPFETLPCDFTMSGRPTYRTALAIGPDGIMKEQSALEAISAGSFNDHEAIGIQLNSESHNFNGIMVVGGEYEIKDSEFNIDSISDGSDVCDFDGYGSTLSVYKGGKLTLDNVKVHTEGVAKTGVFNESSDLVMKNSLVEVYGGELYDGYVNSADVSQMVSPPWVLGITGSARATNLVGNKASFIVVDSDVRANQWGVLSTDVGGNMQMQVLDSKLTLTGHKQNDADRANPYHYTYGSGYGTYALGTDEFFYGCEINVGTYAVNISGGNATYASSNGHFRFDSKRREGALYEGEGKGNPTIINSDKFGFMAHNLGHLTVTDGTIVNCVDAPFHLKAGGVRLEISDGVKINTKSDVLIQLIDDDDPVVGTNPEGPFGLTFNTVFREASGWPSENGKITSKMDLPMPEVPDEPAGPPPGMGDDFVPPPLPEKDSYVTLKNVALFGNIYNATGYFAQEAKGLYVTIGENAVLDAAISATEVMHIDENGKQNTEFTSKQYYYLGSVRHRNFYNGDNDIHVTLTDNAVWNVTGEGMIASLTVGTNSKINGAVYLDGVLVTPEPGKAYTGTIVVTPC